MDDEVVEVEVKEEPKEEPKKVKKKPGRKPGQKSGYTQSEKTQAQREQASKGGVEIELPNGMTVTNVNGAIVKSVGKIGDDKIGAFINYHMEMFAMRQGVNKKDVNDLYRRFVGYLQYCAEHNIMPNNMNAYFAIGVNRQDIDYWSKGVMGTPGHKQFALDVKGFFESIHEQAPTEGLMNPISAMFWQKTHDGFIEAQKVEVTQNDPLGERTSTEKIAEKYDGLLPD